MTSQWCSHSDHCCNHSDHLITIGHQQLPIVLPSFVNPLDTNCKINSQLSNETRHIFHHINEYAFFKSTCVIKAGTHGCVFIDNERVVSTKCTPGFACRAFSDTILVCFIVNEHTTKCSHYKDTIESYSTENCSYVLIEENALNFVVSTFDTVLFG